LKSCWFILFEKEMTDPGKSITHDWDKYQKLKIMKEHSRNKKQDDQTCSNKMEYSTG